MTEQTYDLLAMYDNLTADLPETVGAFVAEHDEDKQVLIDALGKHKKLAAEMKLLEAAIEGALLRHEIDFGGEETPYGWMRVHRTASKKVYDNPRVIGVAAEKMVAALTSEEGELPPTSEAIRNTVETMADLVGARTNSFNSWRTTKAKEIGLELSLYSESEGGRLTVSFGEKR